MGLPNGGQQYQRPAAPQPAQTTAQWSDRPHGYAPGDGRDAPNTAAAAHPGSNGVWQRLPAYLPEHAVAAQPIATLQPYLGEYGPNPGALFGATTQAYNPNIHNPDGSPKRPGILPAAHGSTGQSGYIPPPQGAVSAPQDFVSSFRGAAGPPLGGASRSALGITNAPARVMSEQTYDRGAGESSSGIRAANEAPSGSASHAVEQGDYGSTTTVNDVTGEEIEESSEGVFGGNDYENALEDKGWEQHPDDTQENIWTEPGNPNATWKLNPETGQLTRVHTGRGYDPMTGNPYVGWDRHGAGRPPRDGEDFTNKDNGIRWKWSEADRRWRKWDDPDAEKRPEDKMNRDAWEENRKALIAQWEAEIRGGMYDPMQMDPARMEGVLGARRQRAGLATSRAAGGAMRSMARSGIDPSVSAAIPAELYQNEMIQGADHEAVARLQFEMQNFSLRLQANQQKIQALNQIKVLGIGTEDARWASQEEERIRQENTDLQLMLADRGAQAQAMQQAASERASMWGMGGSIAGAALGGLATVLTAGLAAPAIPALMGVGQMAGSYAGSAQRATGLGQQPYYQW